MTAAEASSDRKESPTAATEASVVDEFDPYDRDLAWLAELAPPGEPIPTPVSDDVAEKMLRIRARMIREIDAVNARFEPVIAEVRARADEEIGFIEARRQDLISGSTRQLVYLNDALTEYARARRAETKATKVDLPHGRLQTRAGRQSTEISDADKLLAWARAFGDDEDRKALAQVLVRRRYDVTATTVKDALDAKMISANDDGTLVTAAGEILPGVKIVTGDVNVTVEPATL